LVGDNAFRHFPDLPGELQQSIWKYAVENASARVVEARWAGKKWGWISNTLCPSLLHTCGVSRTFGRIRYEPAFFGKRFSRTYIDWETDTVVFEPDTSASKVNYLRLKDVSSPSIFENCKSLAISCKNIGNMRLFRRFQNLRNTQILFFSKFGPLGSDGDLVLREFELGHFTSVYERIRSADRGTYEKVSTCHALRDKYRRLKGKAKKQKWRKIKQKIAIIKNTNRCTIYENTLSS
jgi:hypothetical protein